MSSTEDGLPMGATTCVWAESDAAYVLGALSPAERLAFEQHLPGCPACSRSVQELAGIPGLLARVDPTVLDREPDTTPVPETLLPHLLSEVRRTARRRVLLLGGTSAAAVLAVLTLSLTGVLGDHSAAPTGSAGPSASGQSSPSASSGPSGQPTNASFQAMSRIGNAPLRAQVAVEPVAWGTRLDLSCTYAPDVTWGSRPYAMTYTLVIRTRQGLQEQVGTWRATEGKTVHLTAATATRAVDIASVEVRTTKGRAVLQLTS